MQVGGSTSGWSGAKRGAFAILLVVALASLPIAFVVSGNGGGWGRPAGSVALIELTGTIQSGSGDALGDEAGVRPVVRALLDARDDARIAAAVVRINSGGGSAAASQEVHRAILKLRDAGKPVVISMGDVAASGGYYAAVAGDKIFANPSTITGSIGVYAQYLNAAELADTYGVRLETIKTGPFKDIGNPTAPITPAQREVIQGIVDDSLDQFVAAVAEGRGLDPAVVRKLADGRPYTGAQAKANGLIDEFGGLEDATLAAAEMAHVKGKPHVVRYGRPEPLLRRYLGFTLSQSLETRLDVLRELIKALKGRRDSNISLRY